MKKVTRQDVLNQMLSNYSKNIYTCIPGNFVAFTDSEHQRAQVQIGVQRVDVYGSTFSPPPITDVPVIFPGGDYSLEYELANGAEGLIFFSQRCVDGWKQTGGVATNPVARFHHPQDAFFMPGARSLLTALADFQNNGVRLRNADGTQYVWLKNDKSVNLKNPNGYVTLGADGTVNANGTTIDKDGNLVLKSGATITDGKGVVLDTHTHPGVETGDGNTGEPQ